MNCRLRQIASPLVLSLVLASQILSVSAWAQTPSSAPPFHIPFEYDPEQGGAVAVLARINGGPPLPFLLDTGSESTVAVEDWVARPAHFPLTGEVFTMMPGKVKLAATTEQKFLIAGTDVVNSINVPHIQLVVGALDLQNEKGAHGRLAGIIGMPLIAPASLRIDFDARMIYWDFHPQMPPAGSTTFALQGDDKEPRFFVTLPTPDARPVDPQAQPVVKDGSPPVRLVLDTGAQSSTFPIDLISRLRPHAAFLRTSSDHVHSYLNVGWLVPSLSGCGLNVKNIELVEDASREPAMGMDILSQFSPTLDFPDQRLWLQPRRGIAEKPRGNGFVGLHLSETNVVDFVRLDSLAARAGLRAGMRVLAVDGRPLDTVLPVFQGDLVAGAAGTTAVLRVATPGGKQRTIKFVRPREDDPTTFLSTGVRVSPQHFLPGYGVIVDAILCSSVAYASGLRAGDVIRSVDGNMLLTKTYSDAATKLMPRVEALLQKPSPSLALSVWHLGAKSPQTVTLSTLKVPADVTPPAPAPVAPTGP